VLERKHVHLCFVTFSTSQLDVPLLAARCWFTIQKRVSIVDFVDYAGT
jgi:hypothetical protein